MPSLALLKYGGIALLVVAVLAYTYHAGGNAPRAELAAQRAIAEAQVAHVKQVEATSKEIAANADTQAKSATRISDAYYKLRHSAGSGAMRHHHHAPRETK